MCTALVYRHCLRLLGYTGAGLSVAQRTREIGIGSRLGAQARTGQADQWSGNDLSGYVGKWSGLLRCAHPGSPGCCSAYADTATTFVRFRPSGTVHAGMFLPPAATKVNRCRRRYSENSDFDCGSNLKSYCCSDPSSQTEFEIRIRNPNLTAIGMGTSDYGDTLQTCVTAADARRKKVSHRYGYGWLSARLQHSDIQRVDSCCGPLLYKEPTPGIPLGAQLRIGWRAARWRPRIRRCGRRTSSTSRGFHDRGNSQRKVSERLEGRGIRNAL